MKLFFAAISLLCLTRADDEDASSTASPSNSTFFPIGQRSIKQIRGMLSWLDTMTNKDSAKHYQGLLKDYGCHCFVGGASQVGGRGAPIDAIDEACRTLSMAHICLGVDSNNGEYMKACDRTSSFSWYGTAGSKTVNCGKDDGDVWGSHPKNECKMMLCSAEKLFAESVFALLEDGQLNNAHYGANDANLCIVPGGGDPPTECCGDYPHRKPLPDMKQCCGDKGNSYNPSTNDCCNGAVTAFGNC